MCSSDLLGRYYCYYSQAELHSYLGAAGIAIDMEETGEGPGLSGTVDPWIQILGTRRSK